MKRDIFEKVMQYILLPLVPVIAFIIYLTLTEEEKNSNL